MGEEIAASHVDVADDGHIGVPDAGIDLEFEALVGLDERVDQMHGINHAYVFVHVAGGEHEVALQIFGEVGVFVDFVDEFFGAVFLHFFADAVIFFAPVAVIDVVVVIAGFGPAGFVELRILHKGCGGHETAAGMAPHADAGEIYVGMNGGESLGGNFFVGEAVVAEIAVAVTVIPFIALRASAARTDLNDDETKLRERDIGALRREGFVHLFNLRARIDKLDQRIFARGIEVKRLVDYAVEIGDAIFGFDFEDFRKFETGFEELRDIGGFEIDEVGRLAHRRAWILGRCSRANRCRRKICRRRGR